MIKVLRLLIESHTFLLMVSFENLVFHQDNLRQCMSSAPILNIGSADLTHATARISFCVACKFKSVVGKND